jgi:predicted deacylase
MRIEQLGEGEPEIAIVGGIHGDEPCGVRAVEHLLDARPAVERPVKCIVANEEALSEDTRYIDADLNRVFPGDPDSDAHEERLAAALLAELRDCATLSMHSTQSYTEPFAVIGGDATLARALCPYLTLDAVVDTSAFIEGRLIEHADVVEVECGYQGSQHATENAITLVEEFLAAVGALPGGEPNTQELPVYRLTHLIPKEAAEAYDVPATNFERVAAGEPYATIDGEELVAESSFYPVLMSPYGYENEFGYAAELAGKLGGEPVNHERNQSGYTG